VDIWTVGRVAGLGLVVLLGSHIGTMIRKRHSKLAITFKSPKLDVGKKSLCGVCRCRDGIDTAMSLSKRTAT
jgi:hypothetical protein